MANQKIEEYFDCQEQLRITQSFIDNLTFNHSQGNRDEPFTPQRGMVSGFRDLKNARQIRRRLSKPWLLGVMLLLIPMLDQSHSGSLEWSSPGWRSIMKGLVYQHHFRTVNGLAISRSNSEVYLLRLCSLKLIHRVFFILISTQIRPLNHPYQSPRPKIFIQDLNPSTIAHSILRLQLLQNFEIMKLITYQKGKIGWGMFTLIGSWGLITLPDRLYTWIQLHSAPPLYPEKNSDSRRWRVLILTDRLM